VLVADENVVLEAGQISHKAFYELGGVEVEQGQNSGGRITSIISSRQWLLVGQNLQEAKNGERRAGGGFD
jgi:hypothetical protein